MSDIEAQVMNLHRATNRNTPHEREQARRCLERMGAGDLVEMVLGVER
jgi:hypothetical protein